VDIVIQTHLPKRGEEGADILSRNHINVLSAAVVVALPGREGTRTEVALALHYRKPLIAYLGPDGQIEKLMRTALPAVAMTLEEATAFVRRHVSR
jgi:predicted Rossmann-fold nucleotide-binding protein